MSARCHHNTSNNSRERNNKLHIHDRFNAHIEFCTIPNYGIILGGGVVDLKRQMMNDKHLRINEKLCKHYLKHLIFTLNYAYCVEFFIEIISICLDLLNVALFNDVFF